MRQVLVDAGDEAEHLAQRALADLDDRTDGRTVLVEHPVLVRHLDQLGLLVHHQDRLVEERATGDGLLTGGLLGDLLVRGGLLRGGLLGGDPRGGRCLLPVGRMRVLGPAGAVPVAQQLGCAMRIREPARGYVRLRGH
ncbi:hypothetical protein Smic_71140 [Streptomyces microflavus]|uniref:Uncharacterized protein n=1 Tax=Streptomyces microflavus TaxID=1919 RepID=A0A7J0D1I4_STRMI|nr:hypothetical protein Smic_71140 [Streptomyces microflavus]